MNSYVLYKPKKDQTGMAANFQLSQSKNKKGDLQWNLFLTLGKQKPSTGDNDAFDWNDEQGKAKHTISLGLPDIGALLSLFIGTNNEIKLYHEYEKNGKKIITNITGSIYSSKAVDGTLVPKGYSLNILRDGEKLGFGVSFAEAEILRVLLQEAILNMTFVEYKGKQ